MENKIPSDLRSMFVSRLTALFFIVTLTLCCAVAASAQSKEFKNEWKKLISPVYVKSDAFVDGLPQGNASFGVFGFEGKNQYAADLSAEGNITNSSKGDKEYIFTISDGTFTTNQGNFNLSYKGSFAFDISYSKADKCPQIIVIFTGGTMTYNGTVFPIEKSWYKDTGMLEFLLDSKSKGTPAFTIDTSRFNMPQVVTTYGKATPQPQYLKDLSKGGMGISQEDSMFIYSILPVGVQITSLPDYQEKVSTVKVNGVKKCSTVVGSSLGASFSFPGIKATMYPNTKILKAAGHSTLQPLTAYLRIIPGESKVYSVKWENESATYDDGDLTRLDGSKLIDISFKPEVIQGVRGNIIHQLNALQELLDPDQSDYSKVQENYGMRIGSYVSPDGKTERIVDGKILSIEQRNNIIRNEELEWGDKGFIEISNINIGGWNGKGTEEVNHSPKYLKDLRNIYIDAKIIPHAVIPRNTTYDIKILSPTGSLLRSSDSKPGYTYSIDAVIKDDENNLDLGTYNIGDVEPGTYNIEIYCKGNKIGSAQQTVSRPPASAKFVNIDETRNYYMSGRDQKGLYITFDIETESLKGQDLIVSMKYYLPNGKPATYGGKPVEQSYTINSPYESTKFSDHYFFFSNSWTYGALPGVYGKLEYRMVIKTKAGKVLDTYKGYSNWN